MDEEFDTSSDVSSDIDTDVSDVEFDETDMSDVSDDIPEDDYSNDEEFTDDTDGDYEEDTDSFDEDVGVDNYDFTEDDVETEDIAEDSISEIEEDSGTEKFDDELSDVDDDIEEDTEDFDETEDMESSEEIDEIEEDTEEFQETDEETDCADEVIEEDVEDVTEDTATEIEEDTVEDTTVDSEENMAEDTTAETEEDVVEETETDTEEGEDEDTTSETEEGATEDTATETEKDVVEDTATETEEGVAEETTTEMEEGVAEETTTDTEEGTAEETATEMKEDVGEGATTEIGEDVAEDTMDETVEGTAVDTGTETADRTSFEKLSEYMNEHNYGQDDFETYSQDPVWRELHGAAYPDYEMPTEKGNDDVAGEFVSGKEMIEQFSTEKHRYGSDYFVKGEHFEQFENDYYTSDNSTYTEYETPHEIDISSSLIEGIHLGESEVENPSIFWGQHETGGTAESFQEIASHIPKVRERLASGDTLDDLSNDEKLSECANIYFKNKPQVIERDGYYEFDSNGRHRIMAARALGHDIPVSVVGKRSYNESDSDRFEASFFYENPEVDSVDGGSDDSVSKNELTEDFELKSKVPRREFDSKEYSSMADMLEKTNVEFHPIQLAQQNRTPQDIIKRLSGGDMTRGSCSSLALAYAGNKAGYDVLDFRDGDSRSFFSSRSSIQMIADMPGIKSSVLQGTNDMATANQLLSNMQEGKEYYLATGGHAAIVRNNGTNYEYLELQHPSSGNGWHVLNNDILQHRFGCRETRQTACSSFLMDVDSMTNSKEFKNILGFINTAEFKQRKGGTGNVR